MPAAPAQTPPDRPKPPGAEPAPAPSRPPARAAEVPSRGAEAEREEIELHFREVFDQYVAACNQCGSSALTYEAIHKYLSENRASLMRQHGCRSVRFKVSIQGTRPTIKGFLVR